MTGLADWMIDTFAYTGALIALVLLARRPVARHFGPQIAYGLWALPLLRFVMPPITLPAWMNPAEPVAQAAPAGAEEPLLVIVSEASATAAPLATSAAASATPGWEFPLTAVLLVLWLGGATLFLLGRTRDYLRMRRDLLADARPMGEAGRVRLVETPAVSAPVAFGIRDKVVALPVDFMALIDVKARDMAIAHELEHHRGHDLLANIAAQPLLALHWFNPLAWWGWRAMRIDQEAACDARVVCGRARPERAAYAEVIAGFAAGEHLALAAPMACPVLGEKSIIHRLRSLTMSDISTRRRRIGIAAITTTALALPLTASITYAQPGQDQEATAPAAPGEDTEIERRIVWVHGEGEGEGEGEIEWQSDGESHVAGDGDRHVEVQVIHRDGEGEDGERRIVRRIVRHGEHGEMSEAEIEAMVARLEAELEGLGADIERRVALAMEHRIHNAEGANDFVFHGEDEGGEAIDVRCDGDQAVAHQELADGRRAMVICHTAIRAHAAEGLRGALSAIAENDQISAEVRAEIIRELEQAIEEMESAQEEARQVSYRMAPPKPTAVPGASRAAVAFRVSSDAPLAGQPVRMVSPITGATLAPAVAEDCNEAEARRSARVVRRVTA